MTKHVQITSELPVGVETAWQALTSDGWTERVAAEVGTDDREVSVTRSTGEVVVVSSRSLPENIPGPLGKVVPAGLRPTQTDTWEAHPRDVVRHATWQVDSAGVPIRIGGTIRLEPTADGCRRVVDADVTVKVPLIGGKLEGMVADLTRKQAEAEGAAAARLLGGATDA